MLRAEEKKRCFRGGTVEIEREVEGGVVHESSSCLRYSEVLPGVDKVAEVPQGPWVGDATLDKAYNKSIDYRSNIKLILPNIKVVDLVISISIEIGKLEGPWRMHKGLDIP
ncbi:hypothetical protein PCH_Pc12g06720 [Penicillium rubens Wisconsin 54-1255]|uniref:Uncharacterized protein n=1 Tax=Penicillium rubens (strain ATCC 28089 / DSM 1075 / NRRL 1951 / Wisconsin 54-1255) TaxID=500485 RepID=B6H0N2_PENRW|nr:hypothetical protein PCH_Pc12g06720 [Penicillium rubens Wisconsin 54-1255]